jgi:nucleolin
VATPASKVTKAATTPVAEKTTKSVQKVSQKKSSSESDSSSDDDETPPPSKSTTKAAVAPAAKTQKKAASSSSSSSSDEDEEKPVAKVAVAQQLAAKKKSAVEVPAKKATKKKSSSSESDSSSDDEPAAPPAKTTPKAAIPPPSVKTQKKAAKSSSSSESDSSSDDDAAPPPKVVAKAAIPPPAVKSQKKPASSSSSSEEDDESEDEKKSATKVPAKVSVAQKKAKKESSSSSEESDSDEEEKPAKVANHKKAEKMEVDEESSDEDDEETGVNGVESNEETSGKKRKAKETTEHLAKKPKVEEVSGGKELFIRGVQDGVKEKHLTQFFQSSGIEVESIRLIEGKTFCYVTLANASDVSKAVSLSGTSLKKSVLSIEVARPKGQKLDQAGKSPGFTSPRDGRQQFGGRGDNSERDKRTVFLKNLPYSADEDSIAELCGEGCTQVRLPLNEEGRPKGFAFVEFSDASLAEALLKRNDLELEGRQLYADHVGGGSGGQNRTPRGGFTPRGGGSGQKFNNDRTPGAPSSTLIVKNLAFSATSDSLAEVFEGSVAARVLTHADTGNPRGIAFVEFSSVDAAEAALKKMQGQSLDGRQISLDFAEDRGSGGGGRGGFRGGRGGGFRGGRGGDRGGGFRGGRGGRGRGAMSEAQQRNKGVLVEAQGKRTTFNGDSD